MRKTRKSQASKRGIRTYEIYLSRPEEKNN